MTDIHLNSREKILLHLGEFTDVREHMECTISNIVDVPRALSQEGIVKGVGISQSRLSRLMKNLVDDGYISEVLAYIDDEKERKRKAYFLTQEGSYQAKKLKEIVGNTIITIREDDDKTKNMKISDVIDYLKVVHEERMKEGIGENLVKIPSYLEIINCTSADGVFNPKAIVETVEETKYIDFVDHVPELKYFFGRKEELDVVSNCMSSNTEKIVVINGIAGIGKTTFLTKILEDYKGKSNVYYYRFHEWSTLKSVVVSLSEFLSKMGKKTLGSYRKSKNKLDITEISLILEDTLRGSVSLLIFDDYHKVEGELVQFFTALMGILEQMDNVKLIVSGRYIPQFYDRREVRVKNLIVEIELKGLDEKSSGELLRLRNLREPEIEKIYELTGGHPLCLELIESSDLGTQHITKFIREEVLSKLTDEEKSALSIASVFRLPFDSRAFSVGERMKTMEREQPPEPGESIPIGFIGSEKSGTKPVAQKPRLEVGEISYEIIDQLIDKSLLQVSGGLYDVHDLIGQFFYDRLTPSLKRRYHENAAGYYLEEKGYRNYIESQYHTFNAGEHETAAKELISHGKMLINNGYAEELKTVLEIVVSKGMGISIEQRIDILSMLGSIYELIGEYEKGMNSYKSALELCDNQLLIVDINMKIGNLFVKKGDLDDALGYYYLGLGGTGENKRLIETGKLYGNIGWVYIRKGEYENAEEYIMKAIKIIEEIGNERVLGEEYQKLGTLYSQKGNYGDALKYYEKSLKSMKGVGDQREIRALYHNMGNIYYFKGDYERALEYYERGLIIGEKISDQGGIRGSLSNIGSVYSSKGKLEIALDFFERSLEIAEKIGNHMGISLATLNIGNIHSYRGDYEHAIEYYERSLRINERLGTKMEIAHVYHNIGTVKLMVEMYDDAMEYYEKSLEICEKIDNKLFLIYNYCGMAEVNVRKGDLAEALHFCDLAYDMSKEIGTKETQGGCLRIFGMIHRGQKKWAESVKSFEESIDIFQKMGQKMELAPTLYEYGLMWIAKGEKNKSERYLEDALSIFKELGAKGEIEKIEKANHELPGVQGSP